MNDKKTFIVIIILLIIFVPMVIFGSIKKANNSNPLYDDNPNKDYIFNNRVYFYNKNNKLISKYDCNGKCDETKEIIDDDTYNINSIKMDNNVTTNILNDSYALFDENDKQILYNYKLNKKMITLDSVKTYNNLLINENILIAKIKELYGIIKLNPLSVLVNYKYNFIGIPNRINNNILDVSKFIAKTNDNWLVINQNDEILFESFDPIIDFNDNYIITYDGINYNIFDYAKNSYLNDISKDKILCVGDFLLIIKDNILYLYIDLKDNAIKEISLPLYQEINFKINNNKLDIFIDNNLYQSINL